MAIIWVIIGLTFFAIVAPWILKLIVPHEVTLREVGISTGISIAISVVCFILFALTVPRSTEILNGVITDKQKTRVHCSHSYSCNCRQSCSGTGSNRTCTTICQTCYEHSYDYDWRVYNTINNYINIARINRQGTRMPPRWDKVQIGEAFSLENSYVDYLKTTENSLFSAFTPEQIEKYQTSIPAYPNVYDYYRVNLITSTHPIPNSIKEEWNSALRERLKKWGSTHQINIVIVFTKHDRGFYEYLKSIWRGGRKNDAILILNVNEDGTLAWGDIFSWSKDEYFNSIIRANLNGLEEVSVDNVMGILDKHVAKFERRPMEEFKYLLKEREYSWWQILLVFVLQLAGNGILWYIILTNSERHHKSNIRRFYR